MGLLDVTRFDDNIPGLKAGQDEDGDIRMTFTPGGHGEPIAKINFSSMARRVLALFGLKDPDMEKYAVEDRHDLQRRELAGVQSRIKTIQSNDKATEMTKESSAALEELHKREAELVAELGTAS